MAAQNFDEDWTLIETDLKKNEVAVENKNNNPIAILEEEPLTTANEVLPVLTNQSVDEEKQPNTEGELDVKKLANTISTIANEVENVKSLNYSESNLDDFIELMFQTKRLSNTLEKLSSTSDKPEELKISLTKISVGDIVIFFPLQNGNYVAFSFNCPNYFLAEDCKSLIGKDRCFQKGFAIGRVVVIETETAKANQNPFNLCLGSKYHTVFITSISDELIS